MKIKTRHIVALIALAALGSIGYGFYLQDADPQAGHRWIGLGTVGLFLVAMPLFLIKESRGKKMKDYMLNEENIRKMRQGGDQNEEEG